MHFADISGESHLTACTCPQQVRLTTSKFVILPNTNICGITLHLQYFISEGFLPTQQLAQVASDAFSLPQISSRKESASGSRYAGLADVYPIEPFTMVHFLDQKDLPPLDRALLRLELHADILRQPPTSKSLHTCRPTDGRDNKLKDSVSFSSLERHNDCYPEPRIQVAGWRVKGPANGSDSMPICRAALRLLERDQADEHKDRTGKRPIEVHQPPCLTSVRPLLHSVRRGIWTSHLRLRSSACNPILVDTGPHLGTAAADALPPRGRTDPGALFVVRWPDVQVEVS